MAERVLWISIFFIVYTYFLYPVIISVLARFAPKPVLRAAECQPTVRIVIAASNEAATLPSKLESLSKLDYPKNLLRITVVSDGSTDGTNSYLEAVEGIDVIALPDRSGKAAALNAAIAASHEDILIFTDSRQTLSSDAVKELVADLSAPGVGAVSGTLEIARGDDEMQEDIGLYWKYERWIRGNEAVYHSVPGVTGALYAMRRADIAQLPADTILDDFEQPLNALRKKMRVVLNHKAIAYDEPVSDIGVEQRRKIRTLSGNWQSFLRNGWLFLPWKNPIWFQFLSHKVFRLLVPFAMIAALVAAGFSDSLPARVLFLAQVVFYLLVLMGKNIESLGGLRPIRVAIVFVDLNLAALVAFFKYLNSPGRQTWEKTR